MACAGAGLAVQGAETGGGREDLSDGCGGSSGRHVPPGGVASPPPPPPAPPAPLAGPCHRPPAVYAWQILPMNFLLFSSCLALAAFVFVFHFLLVVYN